MTGVDYRAALAMAPAGCDREALKALILQAEAGMLEGVAELAQKGGEDG